MMEKRIELFLDSGSFVTIVRKVWCKTLPLYLNNVSRLCW